MPIVYRLALAATIALATLESVVASEACVLAEGFSGEANLMLRLSYLTQAPYLGVIVPITVESSTTLEDLENKLRPQFADLCEQQKLSFHILWDTLDCVNNLLSQLGVWMRRTCRNSSSELSRSPQRPIEDLTTGFAYVGATYSFDDGRNISWSKRLSCPPIHIRVDRFGAEEDQFILPIAMDDVPPYHSEHMGYFSASIVELCAIRRMNFTAGWTLRDCIDDLEDQAVTLTENLWRCEGRLVATGVAIRPMYSSQKVVHEEASLGDTECNSDRLYFPCDADDEQLTARYHKLEVKIALNLRSISSWSSLLGTIRPQFLHVCRHGIVTRLESWDAESCFTALLGQLNERIAGLCQQIPHIAEVELPTNAAAHAQVNERFDGKHFASMLGAPHPYRFDLHGFSGSNSYANGVFYKREGGVNMKGFLLFRSTNEEFWVVFDGRMWSLARDRSIIGGFIPSLPWFQALVRCAHVTNNRSPWDSAAQWINSDDPGVLLNITVTAVAVRIAPKERSADGRVALCFFGINRSLRWTYSSIKMSLFDQLELNKIPFDTYFHTYAIGAIVGNKHAGEMNTPVSTPFEEALALGPHLRSYSVSDQHYFDREFVMPKRGFNASMLGFSASTLQNACRELNSVMEVTKLWEDESFKFGMAAYDSVVYMRPDHVYHDLLDVNQLLSIRDDEFLSPPYQRYGGINDRYIAGPPGIMRLFGWRLTRIEEYIDAVNLPFFPESFGLYILVTVGRFKEIDWRLRASRVRATGQILCSDYWSSREGLGHKNAPECSPWHPLTPPCIKSSPVNQSRSRESAVNRVVQGLPCTYRGYAPALKLWSRPNDERLLDQGYLPVNLNINIPMYESFDALRADFEPKFLSLCTDQQEQFQGAWNSHDCAVDLWGQLSRWVVGVCGGLVKRSGLFQAASRFSSSPSHLHGQPSHEKCLIFYHVPKAAGMSLVAWFLQQGLSVWSRYKLLHTADPDLALPADADVYIGHWGPSSRTTSFQTFLREHGMNRRCHEVTLLRHPVDRASSNLHFFEGELYNSTKWHGMSDEGRLNRLVEVMEASPLSPLGGHYSEVICRQFSGLTPTWDAWDDSAFFQHWNRTCDIDRAKQVLSQLSYVGFVDRMSEALEAFATMLGLSAVAVPAENWNLSLNPASRQGLPARLLQLLDDANRNDSILYDWALDRTTSKSCV